MLKKIFKNKPKNKKENTDTKYLILFLVIGVFLGVVFDAVFKNIALFFVMIVFCLTIYFLLCENLLDQQNLKNKSKEIKEVISFYESFILFTSLTQSYIQGMKLAVENLSNSFLKDSLTDYLEISNEALPVKCLNDRLETNINDFIHKLYYSNEEVNRDDLTRLNQYISQYKSKLNKEEDYSSIYYPACMVFLSLLIMLLY